MLRKKNPNFLGQKNPENCCIFDGFLFFRARKGEKAATDKEQKTKAAEDALWKDDDKSLKKKQVHQMTKQKTCHF
jgi:hypothetical protein